MGDVAEVAELQLGGRSAGLGGVLACCRCRAVHGGGDGGTPANEGDDGCRNADLQAKRTLGLGRLAGDDAGGTLLVLGSLVLWVCHGNPLLGRMLRRDYGAADGPTINAVAVVHGATRRLNPA